MHNLTLFLTTVFLGFFAMLNPIGNTPVFISMVGKADEKTIKKVAFRAVLVAFILITIFSLFGHIIFRMFGITLPAFQIAGGIIVFFIGYNLLQGKESGAHSSDNGDPVKSLQDMAISPLGIPLLAGPGTISTAMNFVGEGKNFYSTLLIILIFAVVCAITFLMFILSEKIADKFSTSLIKVVSKIMGLILAVIAIQMVINGIFNVIKEFPNLG
ncbi:MAG: NAAT family transporter [Bacteroidetes bacterium]|nr:NAAT family transporter [Bacteroidota bacterium]